MNRGGFTGPWSMSYDPALAQQPGIHFSTPVRDVAPIRQALLPLLAQLATGCSNPPYKTQRGCPPNKETNIAMDISKRGQERYILRGNLFHNVP